MEIQVLFVKKILDEEKILHWVELIKEKEKEGNNKYYLVLVILFFQYRYFADLPSF